MEVTWETLQLPSKFDTLPVKTHRVINVSFPVFGHFGDVTVGGRSVGSTSGMGFWVQWEVNRSMYGGVLLVFAYFRSGDIWKSGKKHFLAVRRAIPSEIQSPKVWRNYWRNEQKMTETSQA